MTIARQMVPLLVAIAFTFPSYTQNAKETVARTDSILILDASGSMWGQIDGVNKIVIAKDVVEGLIRSLPDEQRIGLVAYGHRKKGDCSDIETLADVGADRNKMITQLRELSPKGKTPLSKSIEHAAVALNYKKNAATVILVSDGLETCDVDPCALAKTLKENGLDFTVHVVGFDVSKEERAGLECIAQETGGKFLAAENADELNEALISVADAGGKPESGEGDFKPSTLHMKATLLSGGPALRSDLSWTITPAAGGDAVFSAENTGHADTEILPGDYIANVVWNGWQKGKPDAGEPKTGSLKFSVGPQQPKVITIPVDLGIPVTLNAPETTPEGVAFNVSWSGPDALRAYVHVSGLDDGPRDAIYFFPTQRARDQYEQKAEVKAALDTDGDGDFDQDDLATAELGAPSIPGNYEVRYILDRPRLILARRPLEVTDSQYVIQAPKEVMASTSFEITWEGPFRAGDFVTLVEAGSETVFERGLTARLEEGKPAKLTTPPTPGDYEVRYILANGYTTYPGMQVTVQASTPLKVIQAQASVTAPTTAVGGSTIDVTWSGSTDERSDDVITVIEPGKDGFNRDSWARLASGTTPLNPAPIRVPAIEGDYELAYVLNPGNRVIARTPIKITRATATLEAPTSVKVGSTIDVVYTGDAFKGDRILFVPAETPDEKMWQWGANYGFWAATEGGAGTIRSRLVSTPGAYEIRYVTGLQNQVLSRTKITVTP